MDTSEQLGHQPHERTNFAHETEEHVEREGGDGTDDPVKEKESRSEPCDSEDDGEKDTLMEDESDFEFSAEDSKDLLSLNEELNNILDPKVHVGFTV